MPKKFITYSIPIDATGGTRNLDVDDYAESYLIDIGAATLVLTGNWTIAPTGTPVEDMVYVIEHQGGITTATGNTITVFGRVLSTKEMLNPCVIIIRYLGAFVWGGWKVSVIMTNNAVNDGKVYADATDPTAGYLDAKTQNSIVVDAATKKIKLSGDVASGVNLRYGLNSLGVRGMFPNTELLYSVLTIIHADILQGFTVPQIAIPNPGVGFAAKIVDVAIETKNWTTPYTTNTLIDLITDTAVRPQYSDIRSLLASVSRIASYPISAAVAAATDTQIIPNKAVYWQIQNGNPDYASGDPAQELKIYICYRLLSV